MPRSIEKVEFVFLSIAMVVGHRDRVRFDGDPALAFEVHGIKVLILLVALGKQSWWPREDGQRGLSSHGRYGR